MKLSTKTVIIAIIISIALFLVGQYTWGNLFDAILPVVGNVKYLETGVHGQFTNSILFSVTLALIPIAALLIWRFGSILMTQKRILTVCIIILAMTVGVLARREMIKLKANNLKQTTVLDYTDSSNPQQNTVQMGIPASTLNFELYAFAGLVAGSIISFFSLRKKTEL